MECELVLVFGAHFTFIYLLVVRTRDRERYWCPVRGMGSTRVVDVKVLVYRAVHHLNLAKLTAGVGQEPVVPDGLEIELQHRVFVRG